MIPLPHRPVTPALSDAVIEQLSQALLHTRAANNGDIEQALSAICTEARVRGLPPEAIVLALKTGWSRAPKSPWVSQEDWWRGYYSAIGRCLGSYFGEDVP